MRCGTGLGEGGSGGGGASRELQDDGADRMSGDEAKDRADAAYRFIEWGLIMVVVMVVAVVGGFVGVGVRVDFEISVGGVFVIGRGYREARSRRRSFGDEATGVELSEELLHDVETIT